MLQFTFCEKKTCVSTEICCVFLTFIFPDLAWCWWHKIKQIFRAVDKGEAHRGTNPLLPIISRSNFFSHKIGKHKIFTYD